ncbi:MAG: methyltransferase family protein [Bacteroidales bacterium]|jgi:protein-S-isoprenylcysteine O-methyltransferase Ste14
MALKHSFEKTGNTLFKYRGYIPIILFLLAIPFMFFANHQYYYNKKTYTFIVVTSIVVSCLGELFRCYTVATTPKGTSGRNRDNQYAAKLNIDGVYSIVRHPLYFSNYLMWLGIMIFTGNIYLIIICSLLFFLYYERIMFAEECYLQEKFGEEFLNWSLKTPSFFPNFAKYKKSSTPFSFKSIIRREYSSVMALCLSFAFIDILRILIIEKKLNFNRVSIYIAIGSVILSLILKIIRHKTNLLDEEDRS